MDSVKIGKFIHDLRIKNGLTQSELANKLSVTSQAISKWENGRGIPDIEMLKKLSEEFNIDISELINGEIREKNTNKKYCFIGIIIFICLITTLLLIFKKNNKTFNFSSLASDNDLFSIKGIVAYDDNKKSIYISDVSYSGSNDDKNKYVVMECILYETKDNTETKISKCGDIENKTENDYQNSKTFKELLEGIEFNVDNYSCTCNNDKCNNLFLKINALNINDEVVTYEIPIQVEKQCKK